LIKLLLYYDGLVTDLTLSVAEAAVACRRRARHVFGRF